MTGDAIDELLASLWPATPSLTGPQVHFVIDAARDPAIAPMVRLGRLEWSCLYDERASSRLLAVAPYIVHLAHDSATTRALLERFCDSGWGFLTVSPASVTMDGIRLHLKRFLRVRDESGTPLVFRFYDPRVLGVYLPSCTLDERRAFLGPLNRIYLPGTGSARSWREFSHDSRFIAPPPPPRPAAREEERQSAAAVLPQLAALRESQWDMRVILPMLPQLRRHLAQAPYRTQRRWMAALREMCRRAEPGAIDIAFECGVLAAAMQRFAAAAGFFESSLAKGEHAATHFNLALCRRQLADHGSAERHLLAALAIDPGKRPYASQLAQTQVHAQRCRALLQADRILEPDLNYQFLGATLLGRHHAEALYRRLDAETAAQTGLPAFADLPDTRRWIREQQEAGTLALAVLHPEHGLIGSFGLDMRHNAAVFYYWVMPAMRGHGFGYAVLGLVLECARRAGIARLYAPVAAENVRSACLLEQAGFEPLPVDAVPALEALATPCFALNLAPWDDDVAPHDYPRELALVLRDAGALPEPESTQA